MNSRKFLEVSAFKDQPSSPYYLLPFRFMRINSERTALVNEIGDLLILNHDDVERIIQRSLSTDETLYADLVAGFYISEHPVPKLLEVLSTRYRTKKSFLDHFTSLHIFVVTLRCEHTCGYCQVSRANERALHVDMSIDDLEKGIDMMFASPSPHVTMEFQGGEPLLAFPVIQYGVRVALEVAKSRNKRITFVVCTNLALIDEEMLLFFKENEVLISTSLDGPEKIHNSNRFRPGRNSYSLTVKGIELSREILGEDRVSALLTSTLLTLEHPKEVVDAYLELGFNSIFLRPISPYGFALKSKAKKGYEAERFLQFFKEALDYILEVNKAGRFFREEYSTIILKKILTPFPVGYVDLQSPAGLINNAIVFNYDGSIYASDEARMLAENGDFTFRLGKLGETSYEEVFYGEKAKQISDSWANECLPGCADCGFQAYCGADPVYHHATQGDMVGFRPTSGFCHRNMEIIRHLIELMDQDESAKQIFLNWAGG